MSTKNKILISAAASLTTIGLIIFVSWKNHTKKQQQRLEKIADEGYETAYDILYPLKKKTIRRFF